MNKKIREIAVKAGNMHETHFGYGRSYDQVIWGEDNIESFAEALIDECIQVVTRKCASPTAREALIEHFRE